MLKIAVLVSGSGSNLQAIMDEISRGNLNASIEMVISNNENAFALERAEAKGIETYVFDRKTYRENMGDKILEVTEEKVDLIVLAGFLSILKGKLIDKFENRIINIHPALIPSFCGKGMYGIKVHEAVIKSGAKFSGCTVHFVNHNVDDGAIIAQEVVPVYFEDTKEILQARVLEKEHKILSASIKAIEENRLEIVDGRVRIKDI